ncbi:MAG TPA: hypothetical protein VMU96_08725 [Casimicrobiaceae bacterium]|nr:hypothetical protein [Casimicrobiaceae bacterium]
MTFAALRVTKCRLCGQPPGGRGGLCSDCSRALARARQGPASSRSGSAGAAHRQRMVERIVLTSPVDPEPARSSKKAGAALWATVGVVAVVVVLAAAANFSLPRPADVKVGERPARVLPRLVESATEGEPADAESSAVSAKMAADTALPSQDSAPASVHRPVRGAPPVRAAADAKAGDASHTSAVVLPQPAIEPPVQTARANIAPSPAAVDDDQALAGMLEKCGEEKFLAGVICEQKVRLRFCEGKWGQVPQCTKKPHVD